MILDKIIIENYGVFGGRHEVTLTPDNHKPIILFGGMNGSGKTTFLDAIQLALYGSRARISNRGRLAYKNYLRESRHRGCGPNDASGITIDFRRNIQGELQVFRLQRYWQETTAGIVETLIVSCNGKYDDILTASWDETIESYLSSGIAHLFFFDGEQIMELAEGNSTADILGTAIHSLLGLDLVDRLDIDLRVFERRQKGTEINQEFAQRLTAAQKDLEEAYSAEERAATIEGTLANEVGRLDKELQGIEETFRQEGGDLFIRRKELETELNNLKSQKAALESQYRELVSNALPFTLVRGLISKAESLAYREIDIYRAREFLSALKDRDEKTLVSLESNGVPTSVVSEIARFLEEDRRIQSLIADEPLLFGANISLAHRFTDLISNVLPKACQQAADLSSKIGLHNEHLINIEAALERVPNEDRISDIQKKLNAASDAHRTKTAELESIRIQRAAAHQVRLAAEIRLEKLEHEEADSRIAEDDRLRVLKHSQRVRETIKLFRMKITQNHVAHIEHLVLESFHSLLYKRKLVDRISINPETYETTLIQPDGQTLPLERLSAGEKQLLATSLLWGLARASGRSVPTIIDTPLGRLDSAHRQFLVNRYFPNASHQVLLLSTDEEIIGSYLDALSPLISRTYLFEHDVVNSQSRIVEGYFGGKYAATN